MHQHQLNDPADSHLARIARWLRASLSKAREVANPGSRGGKFYTRNGRIYYGDRPVMVTRKTNGKLVRQHATDLDSDRLRFNWGFHDGASEHERGHKRPEGWEKKHFDPVYVDGHRRGRGAAARGEPRESSQPAWEASGRKGMELNVTAHRYEGGSDVADSGSNPTPRRGAIFGKAEPAVRTRIVASPLAVACRQIGPVLVDTDGRLCVKAEVGNPGSRGGKGYFDKQGHWRYGVRPSERKSLNDMNPHELLRVASDRGDTAATHAARTAVAHAGTGDREASARWANSAVRSLLDKSPHKKVVGQQQAYAITNRRTGHFHGIFDGHDEKDAYHAMVDNLHEGERHDHGYDRDKVHSDLRIETEETYRQRGREAMGRAKEAFRNAGKK
jgi:hypothetical protein